MASRDNNRIPVLQGVLNTDGETPTEVKANPTSHRMNVDIGAGGSDNGPTDAKRDNNRIPVAMAVSSVDGVTPVVLYVNSSGKLLIDKT